MQVYFFKVWNYCFIAFIVSIKNQTNVFWLFIQRYCIFLLWVLVRFSFWFSTVCMWCAKEWFSVLYCFEVTKFLESVYWYFISFGKPSAIFLQIYFLPHYFLFSMILTSYILAFLTVTNKFLILHFFTHIHIYFWFCVSVWTCHSIYSFTMSCVLLNLSVRFIELLWGFQPN